MKKSKAASILEKIREEEIDQENPEQDQENSEQKPVSEMEPSEMVDFIKNENWSQDPEKLDQVLEAIKKIHECDDEDAKLMVEALDDASSEFDLEAMKEKKAKK